MTRGRRSSEVRHLGAGADRRLHDRADRPERPVRGHVLDAPFQEPFARRGGERRERGDQRPGAESRQPQVHQPLAPRPEVGEIAVDVAGHVLGRHDLAPPLDQHLRQRDQPEERHRMQVAQPVPSAHGGRPPGEEPHHEHEVDRHPRQQRDRRAHLYSEHSDVRRAAQEQRGDLAQDQGEVRGRQDQRRPREPPHVGRADHGHHGEQHVLGERVRQERERARVAADHVAAREQRAQDRVPEKQPAQPPLLGRQGSLHRRDATA
jgi:hypothetical protein